MAFTDVSKAESYKRIYPVGNMYRPHVETDYNDDALSNQSGNSDKNIFLIGSATDGNPSEVYEVTSLDQAKGIFGSGDLVDAMELIWNPANNQTQRGGTVYALRAENAKPASLTKGKFTFTSKVFGDNANQIFLAYDKDAISGANRLEVKYPVKNYDKTYTNIGDVFQVAYTGQSKVAQIEVTQADDSGNATNVSISLGDSEDKLSEVMNLDLTKNSYEKMYQVMDSISSLPGFELINSSQATSIDSKYLDLQKVVLPTQAQVKVLPKDTGADVQVNDAKIEYQTIKSIGGDLSQKLRNDPYVSVAINQKEDYPADFADTPLSGGSTGNVPVSWADKFEGVLGHNVYYIVPLTSQENIHAELKEFMDEEYVYGFNYRGFVGGGFDESDADAISRRISLGSDRIGLVANSGYYTSLSGQKKHIPAYLMAAMVAGVASSLPIGNSLTNKYLDLVSLDQNFAGSVLDRLDANGVIAIERIVNRNASGGYKIVEDVTTSNSTNEPVKALISLGELTDFLFDDLRTRLDETYIGANVRINSADLVKQDIITFLTEKKADGLIVDFSESDIGVTIDGQNIYIIFAVSPSLEVRNVIAQGVYNNYSATTESTDEQ